MKKIITVILILALVFSLVACGEFTASASSTRVAETQSQMNATSKLMENQPTPTDIEYSLERYNLIRRAYWVNGLRDRARTLPCPIADPPLGYIVCFDQGVILGKYVVEGKVSSLNSYLTADSEYYEQSAGDYSFKNEWVSDVDGSFGQNDEGVFFFTPDGNYYEYTGKYLYSDIPFEIATPVLNVETTEQTAEQTVEQVE